MDKKEALNIEILRGYAATPEDVRFFADIFIRQTTSDLTKLRMACEAEAHHDWSDICHKIRGAASMAGATYLHDLCEQGEALGPIPVAKKRAFLQKIEAALHDVCRAFDEQGLPRPL